MIKLIMTWDIKPGNEQEYFAFVLHEYLPQFNKFGFEITDAWVTVYGNRPQILVGAVIASKLKARKVMSSDEWNNLNEQLKGLVDNLEFKLATHKGSFQF